MRTVAIIPARGGSKRITGKNIKYFLGKPIIAYSIEAALKSNIFDRVIVSTDSDEIADVAIKYGAEVPFKRPAEISGDLALFEDVIFHALSFVKNYNGKYQYACFIYPTAPMLKPEFITSGLNLIRHERLHSVFSVTSYSFPIFRSLKINKYGCVKLIWPEYCDIRSQDLPEAYHDAGQFYWLDIDSFLKNKTIYAKTSKPVIIPRYLVQDIDTEEDWLYAEKLYKLNFLKNM